jgi:MoaA/NifB/PqqE/SkfB family radical SAM enzyme
MNIKVPKPISGGIILSYKCNAECRHCMYACSPKWSAEWISKKDLYVLLNILADKIEPGFYGKETIDLNLGVHFTGGEPFLNFELLCEGIEMARELKIPSIFVETNCYWASSENITREKLQILKNRGLNGILISVNPFFLEFVPFERTERTVKIAYEIFGNNMFVYQLPYLQKFKNLGIKGKLTIEEYSKIDKGMHFSRYTEFFIMGRAAYSMEKLGVFPKYKIKFLVRNKCNPPFLRNWHNHFDNYGNFIPGYCGGLSLGDWHKLNQILKDGIDVKQNPVLTFIIKNDFQGLLSFAKDFGYKEQNNGYLSKCHLCVDIRRFLVAKNEFGELKPEEFYTHLE